VEELMYAIRPKSLSMQPLGALYFYQKAPVLGLDAPNFREIKEKWEKREQFRNDIGNQILYKT
jgi:hypothetical protein